MLSVAMESQQWTASLGQPAFANSQIGHQNGDEIPTAHYLEPQKAVCPMSLACFNFQGYCKPFQAKGHIGQQTGDEIPTRHYLKPPKSSLSHVSSPFQFSGLL